MKRQRNPVPPSSRLRAKARAAATVRRDEQAEFDRARRLYGDFSGHEAEPLARVAWPKRPKVAFVVGYCDGILYSTVRDGEPEKYIHRFKKSDRPLLVVDPDGTQLILLGGAFKLTERGIVDLTSKDAKEMGL